MPTPRRQPIRLSNEAAARAYLAAQGFADGRPGRADVRHFRRVIRRIRLLQIDSVNTVVRAHYLPMFSRLGPYDRAALDRWIYQDKAMFEYWCHERSYAPVGFYPMLRPRMEAMRDHPWRQVRELALASPDFVAEVLERVARLGPAPARWIGEGEAVAPSSGWWKSYGRTRLALEWLFATGAASVAERVNFQRWYDLTERLIPPGLREVPPPGAAQADRMMVLEASAALGVGTVDDLADFFRMRKAAASRAVGALAERGELREVEVSGWGKPAYASPDLAIPRSRRGTALLAPFDPLVWDRARTERMFGFRYRIEIYTPRPKRVFGYYVLPFLLNGRMAGRVDVKADRPAGILRIPAAHAEPDADRPATARALAAELRLLAGWLGLSEVSPGRKGNLIRHLRVAL